MAPLAATAPPPRPQLLLGPLGFCLATVSAAVALVMELSPAELVAHRIAQAGPEPSAVVHVVQPRIGATTGLDVLAGATVVATVTATLGRPPMPPRLKATDLPVSTQLDALDGVKGVSSPPAVRNARDAADAAASVLEGAGQRCGMGCATGCTPSKKLAWPMSLLFCNDSNSRPCSTPEGKMSRQASHVRIPTMGNPFGAVAP